jgi:hypothetical protein
VAINVFYFLFSLGHGHGQKQPLSRNCSPNKTENQTIQEKACLLGQIHESVWKTTTFPRSCEGVIFEHLFNKLWTFFTPFLSEINMLMSINHRKKLPSGQGIT